MKSRNTVVVLAVILTTVAMAGSVLADNERPNLERLAKRLGVDAASIRPGELPPVAAGPMKVEKNAERAESTLSWDNGTAESGFIGPGYPWYSVFQKFDVLGQCIQPGLSIRRVSAMVWKDQGQPNQPVTQFLLRQNDPDPWGTGTTVAITGISGSQSFVGGQTWQTASIPTGAAVIDNTVAFFAGLKPGTGSETMVMGMDTDGASNLMHWANGLWYGQQSPAAIGSVFGIKNFMLRVTVEDVNCVPVELMSFSIE